MMCGEIIACPLLEIYRRQADGCLSITETALVMGMDWLASVFLVFYEFIDILKPSEQRLSLIKCTHSMWRYRGTSVPLQEEQLQAVVAGESKLKKNPIRKLQLLLSLEVMMA